MQGPESFRRLIVPKESGLKICEICPFLPRAYIRNASSLILVGSYPALGADISFLSLFRVLSLFPYYLLLPCDVPLPAYYLAI